MVLSVHPEVRDRKASKAIQAAPDQLVLPVLLVLLVLRVRKVFRVILAKR